MEGSPAEWLMGLLADVGSVGESAADCQRKIFRSSYTAFNKNIVSLLHYRGPAGGTVPHFRRSNCQLHKLSHSLAQSSYWEV